MPRLPTQLLHHARALDLHLPLLLRACRDLHSARNELRWLREHADAAARRQRRDDGPAAAARRAVRLRALCRRRATGYPLQYLLGSQPFGELDVLCAPGVLIPRPETEGYTTHLAARLARHLPTTAPALPLRILDACSGSGCIGLLLLQALARHRPAQPPPDVLGLDIDPRAIALARRNVTHNVRQGHLGAELARAIRFEQRDVLRAAADVDGGASALRPPRDVVVANPPYISAHGYATETSRSARNYEPVGALRAGAASAPANAPRVAAQGADAESGDGDGFYLPILELAHRLQAQIVLLEVGGRAQARRVLRRVLADCPHLVARWPRIEIWNDDPHLPGVETEGIEARPVPRRGRGLARSLVFATALGNRWLGMSKP